MASKRPPRRPRKGRRPVGELRPPNLPALGTAALKRFHAERHLHPTCGALAKSTGQPCRQQPAKGRTRCKFHGGATPRGDGPAGWHTPGFPEGIPTDKPRSDAHKARKRRQRRAEIAAMTPEERVRLDEWRRMYKPGSVAERAHGRRTRKAGRWLDTLMRAPPAAPTPEQAKLAALRAKAQAHLERLDAEIAARETIEPPAGGLFD